MREERDVKGLERTDIIPTAAAQFEFSSGTSAYLALRVLTKLVVNLEGRREQGKKARKTRNRENK